jgi:adenylate kinase
MAEFSRFFVILQKISSFCAMGSIKINDKRFRVSISEADIKSRVKEVAGQISKDLEGKNPLFLGVLNGSFIFAADLMREMTIPCEISFVKLASYQGTTSTGKVTEVIGINEDLAGRTIVILEDIVESGATMKRMIEQLGTRNPASVRICTLFFKPDKLKEDLNLDYVAFRIPDDFILGYGLDYDQAGRGLRDVYTITEDKDMKNIVIFGAPGSGKGTQSDKMIEKYGLNHISTGDVLRAEIKNGTELGKTAKGYIDNGQLIPDDLMVNILASVYDSFGREHKGVIFDGFPRTIPQAEALKKMLEERGDKVAAMIELDVPEDELMKRLILRGQQSGRADDNEETIKKRLVVYHSQTQPLIEWYKKKGIHFHIDGLGELDRIFADICAVIDNI